MKKTPEWQAAIAALQALPEFEMQHAFAEVRKKALLPLWKRVGGAFQWTN